MRYRTEGKCIGAAGPSCWCQREARAATRTTHRMPHRQVVTGGCNGSRGSGCVIAALPNTPIPTARLSTAARRFRPQTLTQTHVHTTHTGTLFTCPCIGSTDRIRVLHFSHFVKSSRNAPHLPVRREFFTQINIAAKPKPSQCGFVKSP